MSVRYTLSCLAPKRRSAVLAVIPRPQSHAKVVQLARDTPHERFCKTGSRSQWPRFASHAPRAAGFEGISGPGGGGRARFGDRSKKLWIGLRHRWVPQQHCAPGTPEEGASTKSEVKSRHLTMAIQKPVVVVSSYRIV